MKFQNSIVYLFITFLFSCGSQTMLMETVKGFKKGNHVKESENIMISTQGEYASLAGQRILKLGGNIIDAMTAISFVISVERPQSTGIGGGGFLIYYHKELDKTYTFDFREKAPLSSYSKMYLDKSGNEIKNKSVNGIFAAGVPGLVKGVLDIHARFGKLSREEVLRDAINLAMNGFKVYPGLGKALAYKQKVLCSYVSSAKIFCPNGKVLKEGDTLVQKDLGLTIKRIAKFGNKDFYEGETMNKIVETSKSYKGLLTKKDFKKYNVIEREAIRGNYKGYEILSMPPPSSGGIHIIQILNILENIDLNNLGQYHPKTIHYVSSAMEMAFADRAKYLGDTDFVKVPVKGLVSKEYGRKLFKKIDPNRAFKKNQLGADNPWPYEKNHTTHFSIMDKEGNAVVTTQTVNGWFGSGLVAQGTGILLNNEMDDFSTKPGASNIFGAIGGKNNLVEPEKRPLSSMSPTLVFKNNEPVLALGTPNGTRILTCVMQTILNYTEFKMPIYEAVASARYHHQWRPHHIRFDEASLPMETIKKLEEMGHEVKLNSYGCRIQAIAREKKLIGVSDPRGEGKVIGF